MVKRMVSFVFFLGIVLGISAACAESDISEFVFRDGIKFGMTMQEVCALEEAEPFYATNEVIIYDDVKAAGKAAEIYYLFENDSLNQIGIFFTESHTNENLYIRDFDAVDDSLCEKYGEPTRDSEQFWSANTYKNDPDRWGFAVSIGDLVYGTEYMPTNYPNLWIKHVLQGDNYEFTHMLSYEYSDGTEEHTYNTDGI